MLNYKWDGSRIRNAGRKDHNKSNTLASSIIIQWVRCVTSSETWNIKANGPSEITIILLGTIKATIPPPITTAGTISHTSLRSIRVDTTHSSLNNISSILSNRSPISLTSSNSNQIIRITSKIIKPSIRSINNTMDDDFDSLIYDRPAAA
jgi:hypothetical protein